MKTEVVYVTAKSKWKRHYGIRNSGKTVDGKIVVRGLDVFKMTEAIGVELETILTILSNQGKVVDWIEFIETAKQHGWSYKTTLKKIEYPIIDVFGDTYWKEIRDRFMIYISQQN